MSDYITQATVELNVNGQKAKQAIEEQRILVDNLRKAYAKAIAKGDASAKSLEKEYKKAQRELKSMQSATLNVADVLKRLDRATPKELKTTLKQLTKELNNLERGTKAWDEQAEKIRRVKKELDSVNQSIKQQQTGWQKVSGWLNKWQTMAVAAFAVVMKVVSSARKAVNAYAEMEQEMANVRKYTGMTEEQVEDLNEEFKKMDTRTSREGLNKLAQEAGRLGKKSRDDVLGFVRAADKINVALDDLGEGATLTLSKLTGVFGDEKRLGTEKSLLAVGSVINELSQNSRAASPYLAEFTSRMGGVGAQADMTIPQIMGYATVLDSHNQKVEAAATALSQVITRLYQDPAKYAKPAGLEVQSFAKLLREDANAALILLLESLNKMGNMDVLSPIFAEMGETGSRAIMALTTLAGNIDEVKQRQEEANKAFSEATSVEKEFNIQNNTVQAGLDKAKKEFRELAVDLGQKLLPVMQSAISGSSIVVHILSVVVSWCIKYQRILIPLSGAIVAYWTATKLTVLWQKSLNATKKAGVLIGTAYSYSLELNKIAMMALSGQTRLANSSFKALNATMKSTPWGAIIAAVTAVGVAIYQARSKTDEYTETLTSAVKKANGFTAEAQKEQRELDILFGKLKGAKKGSEEYNDVKNTIISKYGIYLQGLINEKGEIINLTDAYNQLSTAARRSAIERGIANAEETISNKYYEQTSDLLNLLQGNLEIYGASVQEAAQLTQSVASAFGSNEPISDETLTRLTYWSSQKPNASQATSLGQWADLMASNAVFGFPGGDGYYQPNEVVNLMYDAYSKYKKAKGNVDAMADGAAPLRKHDTNTIKMAVLSLETLIRTGVEGSALILDAAKANSVAYQNMTLVDAKKYLSKYKAELSYRAGATSSPLGSDLGEDEDKCPKCGKYPCTCSLEDDDPNADKFKVEKEWKEREEALNRITYASGQKSYEDYRKRIDEIAVEYYRKLMNHTEASADEQLQFEAQYYDALQKQQETNNAISLDAENAHYNDIVTNIKQRYIDGEIKTTEDYHSAIEIAELQHKQRIVQIYSEGTQERLDAERDYQNTLVQNKLNNQKKIEDGERKTAEEIKKLRQQYFGLSHQEQQAVIQDALTNLEQAYQQEIQAAGDNAERKLEIERLYQEARAKLEAELSPETWLDRAANMGPIGSSPFDGLIKIFSEDGQMQKTIQNCVSSVWSAYQSLSDLAVAESEIQIAALEKRYEKEISLAEGNAYKVNQIEKKKEKEIAKAKNEANKKMFAMQVIQAVAQTAQNAISAYGSAAAIPLVGFTLAPIAAAMAVAAGMLQITAIKKQQQASEAQGYASGGFTPKGGKYEPAGIVHKGEWVASQELLASPVARPMIEALDYAQRTNTIGSLKADDVSRTISAPAIIASSNDGNAISESLTTQAVALAGYVSVIRRLNERLDEPFVTVNTVTGDTGIKKAQDDYDKLIRNKTPKSKRK